MLLRKIARPLLGTAFIVSGVDAVRSPSDAAHAADPLLESAPVESETVVRVAGALQIGAGLALATGRAPRVASTVLIGTVIPSTLFASDFWNETDPAKRRMKQSAFVKNLGLLGGAMIASADTEGKPSLAWRGRRGLEKAESAVAGALPGHHEKVDGAWAEDAWNQLGTRASHTAHEVAAHVPVDEIRSRATHFADLTKSRVSDAADAAPGFFDDVRRRAEDLASDVADRAPEVAADARDKAVVVGEQTAARARRWRRELATGH